MILRDESVHIRANLPLWRSFVDFGVFLVDSQTIDDTREAVEDILQGHIPFVIKDYEFDGFGPARTLSLRAAWEAFPHATHVWIADPDWVPMLETIRKEDLDRDHDAFRFTIYDRDFLRMRQCDWLLNHTEGLRMRYRLHEVIDVSSHKYIPKALKWEVREIAKDPSWHKRLHGHSKSLERSLFDLKWIERDLQEYPYDPHTSFYMGSTSYSYLKGRIMEGSTMDSELEKHAHNARKYLTVRASNFFEHEYYEQRWAAMHDLAELHKLIDRNYVSAEYWYNTCWEYDRDRYDCVFELAKMYIDTQQPEKGAKLLVETLKIPLVQRAFLFSPIMFACVVRYEVLEFLLVLTNNSLDILSVLGLGINTSNNGYLWELLYINLLSIVTGPCMKESSISYNASQLSVMKQILQSRIGWAPPAELEPQQVIDTLCTNPLFAGWLVSNGIHNHPCPVLATSEKPRTDAWCSFAEYPNGPPAESIQMREHKEYRGPSSFAQLVYRCRGGLLPDLNVPFTVLFAQNFNPRAVLPLLVEIRRFGLTADVTVLHTSRVVLESIYSNVSRCLPDAIQRIKFVRGSILELASHATKFDYVEFWLDGSEDDIPSVLNVLATKLSESGAIGVSWFGDNFLHRRIRDALALQTPSSALPFHLQDTQQRLVKSVLHEWGLLDYSNDEDLVKFLTRGTGGVQWQEMEVLARTAGLRFTTPIEAQVFAYNTTYPMVAKYRHLGLSDDAILQMWGSEFRHTGYLSALSSVGSSKLHLYEGSSVVKEGKLIIWFEGMNSTELAGYLAKYSSSGKITLSVELPKAKTLHLTQTFTRTQTLLLGGLLNGPVRLSDVYSAVEGAVGIARQDLVRPMAEVLQFFDAAHAVVGILAQ